MHGEKFFRMCARLAIARPWLTLIVCLVLTVAAIYASTWMAINTRTESLFAKDVEFKRNARAYEQVFPSPGAAILAVIDAPTMERAQRAAQDLAQRLRASPLFHRVDAPGLDPVYRRAGLLFLSIEQLDVLRAQIEEADLAMAALSERPDLRGIAEFLNLLATGAQRGYEMPAPVTGFVQALAETTRERADGRATTLSWSSLFASGELQARGKRQFVLAYPVLDYGSMQRAAAAIATARQAADAVGASDEGQGLTVRLTGESVLDQQELDAGLMGAVYASVLSFAPSGPDARARLTILAP
jgi:hypothetical protein